MSAQLAVKPGDAPRLMAWESPHIEPDHVLRASVFVATHIAGANERAPNGEAFDIAIEASTARVSRDGGIVLASAWEQDLARYLRNPVVMWAHSYMQPPIATAVATEVTKRGTLKQWWRFLTGITTDDWDQFAGRVKALYAVGGLRAASVGWVTHEDRAPTQDEIDEARRRKEPMPRWVVTRAELLEVSAVPVPSDPHALAVARAIRAAESKGVDMAPVRARWENTTANSATDTAAASAVGGQPFRIASPESGGTTDVTREADLSAGEAMEEAAGGEVPVDDDTAEAVLDDLDERAPFVVQSLIFPKAKWKDAAACKAWATEHDYRVSKVDETDDSFRLRQRSPDNFERLRTICLSPGRDASMDKCSVKAVGGPLARGEEPASGDDDPEDTDEAARQAIERDIALVLDHEAPATEDDVLDFIISDNRAAVRVRPASDRSDPHPLPTSRLPAWLGLTEQDFRRLVREELQALRRRHFGYR